MPVKKRMLGFDPKDVRLKQIRGGTVDIYVGKEEVGSIDYNLDKNITKGLLLATEFENQKGFSKLFESVPEDYRFNYYYVDDIRLWSPYRGSGIGGIALQMWFSTLKAPACVGLTPARTGNVPYQALLRFYKRNGFKMLKDRGGWFGITFIKA